MKKRYDIVVDSREKKPLFKNCVVKCLKIGDYSIVGYENNICIERKSLPDLFSSLGKNHERFKKELIKSKELDYFAIVVDGSYSDCYNKNFVGSEFSKLKGSVVCKILITLNLKYGINFFFSSSRVYSKILIKDLFDSFVLNN